MTEEEENDLMSEADRFPSASQKTKEQWLEEGKVLTFYAPVCYEEALAAYEQAIRLDSIDGLAYRLKGFTLRALKRYVLIEETHFPHSSARGRLRLHPSFQ